MDTTFAELVILASAVLVQEERPFQMPFLAPAHESPITGTSSAGRACLAFFVPPTLVLHPSTAPEWKFFLRGSPARFDLAFSTSLTRRSLLAIPSIKD